MRTTQRLADRIVAYGAFARLPRRMHDQIADVRYLPT
jgi:hypothetical protein